MNKNRDEVEVFIHQFHRAWGFPPFWKYASGDYRVIITSWATNQRAVCIKKKVIQLWRAMAWKISDRFDWFLHCCKVQSFSFQMFYVIFGWKVKQYCLATKSHQKSQISVDGICTFFFWNFTPWGFGRLSSMIIKMQPQRKLDWTRHKAYKQDGFCKGYRTVRWLNMHNLLSFHLKSIPIGGNMRFLVTFFWRSNTFHFSTQYHKKTYHLKS